MKNQTLQDLINKLPSKLRETIMQETEVKNLELLKAKHKKISDIIVVIDAKIENLTYLAT